MLQEIVFCNHGWFFNALLNELELPTAYSTYLLQNVSGSKIPAPHHFCHRGPDSMLAVIFRTAIPGIGLLLLSASNGKNTQLLFHHIFSHLTCLAVEVRQPKWRRDSRSGS
ncbi:hypothetical protein VNO77_33334 [Canavalia gladiata]|uniref:Uncharacterized protein n=1 Tax=Canavalia gladiata TaxID=3824 RepID=A0AAN9KDJ7_CANGL